MNSPVWLLRSIRNPSGNTHDSTFLVKEPKQWIHIWCASWETRRSLESDEAYVTSCSQIKLLLGWVFGSTFAWAFLTPGHCLKKKLPSSHWCFERPVGKTPWCIITYCEDAMKVLWVLKNRFMYFNIKNTNNANLQGHSLKMVMGSLN